MVDLSDLPPELMDQIIRTYVSSVGINEAWKRRGVCSKSIRGHRILSRRIANAL
jgi:hypothetical protein